MIENIRINSIYKWQR